ncbi:MAG: nitrous oxide reductase accessory protein NosL [Desulfobacterales bacterium]|nr:MAG: nitrous oxide reductase accessory protein NosL [Desulfobacterales bacterium]
MQIGGDGDKRGLLRSDFLKRFFLVAGCIGSVLFGLAMLVGEAGSGPKPGLKPLDEHGRMQISDQDRCPVCAMRVNVHIKFSSAIQLVDGKTFYFCGTGCMIRSWMHPEIFLNASKAELQRSVVQDYFSGEQVDGLAVYWVAGSDVMGPMGPALVPIFDEGQVAVFKNRHGGKAVFRLNEMTDEKWQNLTGRKALPPK